MGENELQLVQRIVTWQRHLLSSLETRWKTSTKSQKTKKNSSNTMNEELISLRHVNMNEERVCMRASERASERTCKNDDEFVALFSRTNEDSRCGFVIIS